MICLSKLLKGVHGGFTRSGGNFRKNNWAKGRLDVSRIMSREPLTEVKFRRPKSVTKHGLPSSPRESALPTAYFPKFCNMSVLHQQNFRRFGMSLSDKSAHSSATAAMCQPLGRK